MLIPVSSSIGLPALAGLILGESAGLPLPGETALIVAGGLAAAGPLSLPAVIVTAALAAIVGDTIGYLIGRKKGRQLVLREGRFASHRIAAVQRADRYFARYGAITVFFARFVPGVRVVGAVVAGTTQMPWKTFAIANALGAFTWAGSIATLAYVVGPSGTGFLVIAGFAVAGVGLAITGLQARRERAAEPALAGVAVVATAAPSPVPASAAAPVNTPAPQPSAFAAACLNRP